MDKWDRDKLEHETRLFDAVVEAADRLKEYKMRYDNPDLRLRILALTDGDDQGSHSSSRDAIKACLRDSEAGMGVTVDAVVIGNESRSAALRQITEGTGGFFVKPPDMQDAVSSFTREPMLTMQDRLVAGNGVPVKKSVLPHNAQLLTAAGALEQQQQTSMMVSMDALLEGEEGGGGRRGANGKRGNKTKGRSGKDGRGGVGGVGSNGAGQGGAGQRTAASAMSRRSMQSRLLTELKSCMRHDIRGVRGPYLESENITIWVLVMDGPLGSAYEGGQFQVVVEFTDDFPDKAPVVRFQTPIWHVNVSEDGRVCHSVIAQAWTQDTDMVMVLQCIYQVRFNVPLAANLIKCLQPQLISCRCK